MFPIVNIDQDQAGTRNQPIQLLDDLWTLKKECSDDLQAPISADPHTKSLIMSSAINEPQAQSHPCKPDRKSTVLADTVHFRFISDAALEPRERSFSQCNNVKKLFSNAKQGGLLEGDLSVASLLALQVPGISNPIGICIGDSKDFDKFVHILQDILEASHEDIKNFTVEVRADHLD